MIEKKLCLPKSFHILICVCVSDQGGLKPMYWY